MVVRYISRVGQNASNYGDEKADAWIAKDEGEPYGPITIILPLLLVIDPLCVEGDALKAHFDSRFQVKEDVVDDEIRIQTESDH